MRILLAQMSHETNTFSPVPTPLARFTRGGSPGDVPREGRAAIDAARGTGTCLGGYIHVCEAAGAQMELAIAAGAAPSGRVDNDAFEYMAGKIVAAARQPWDGIMLDLHGAMVTERFEDGEGELLRRVREVAPHTPIAVALDMHANLFAAMVDNATVISGYHTYPHIDNFETARRAGDVLIETLRGSVRPAMVWGNVPMLPHVMRQGTDDFPNRELQERAAAMENEPGVLAVSLFTGFPHADISNAGLSVVVVTDNDRAQALKLRDELLDFAWRERATFVYQLEPLADSVARAKEHGARPLADGEKAGPVILLDHYDNTASGGTMDTTDVLAEILRQQLQDVAVFGIYDPVAVQQMITAGVGAELTVSLGGKMPMPSIPVQSAPLSVTGRVKLISDGRFRATGPMSRGAEMNMGTCAVLDTGALEIVVVSRHVEPYDPGCFVSVGIQPQHKRYLMLKSRIHYRAGFKPLARAIVECAGVGVCTSDYGQLKFENVRRPIYPLDGINEADWRQVETGVPRR